MKVTFYVDVPEYVHHDLVIIATSRTFSAPAHGHRRVAFDVDFPPEVLKERDFNAVASAARNIAGEIPPLMFAQIEGGQCK